MPNKILWVDEPPKMENIDWVDQKPEAEFAATEVRERSIGDAIKQAFSFTPRSAFNLVSGVGGAIQSATMPVKSPVEVFKPEDVERGKQIIGLVGSTAVGGYAFPAMFTAEGAVSPILERYAKGENISPSDMLEIGGIGVVDKIGEILGNTPDAPSFAKSMLTALDEQDEPDIFGMKIETPEQKQAISEAIAAGLYLATMPSTIRKGISKFGKVAKKGVETVKAIPQIAKERGIYGENVRILTEQLKAKNPDMAPEVAQGMAEYLSNKRMSGKPDVVMEYVIDKPNALKTAIATIEKETGQKLLMDKTANPEAKPQAEGGGITPKVLYRGIMKDGKGAGTYSLGKGLYSSPDKKWLSEKFEFDDIIKLTPEEAYPKNPLIIDTKKQSFEDWLLKESGEKSIRDFNKKYTREDFVSSKGYDGVVAGNEVVKYPKLSPKEGVEKKEKEPVQYSDKMQERLAIVEKAQRELEETIPVKEYLLANKIRRYKDGFLAEELAQLPRQYVTTKDTANTIDQTLDELRNMGYEFGSEQDLIDYIRNLDARRKELKATIDTNKPQKVTKFETTIEKERQALIDKEQNKAMKEMQAMTEEHAALAERMAKKAYAEGKVTGKEIKERQYFGDVIAKEERGRLRELAKEKGLIYTDYKGIEHDMLRNLLSYYEGATYSQMQEYISNLSGDPANKPLLVKMYGDIDKDTALLKIINEYSNEWGDINRLEVTSLDTPRIIEKVTGRDLWDDNILADNTFLTISAADEAMFDRKVMEHNDLEANRMDIKANSGESAELMRKFEAKEPLTDKEQKVAIYLRKKYDEWIAEANILRGLQNRKPIPYRKDYMTHIIEQNILNEFFQGDENAMKNISREQLEAIRKGDYTKGNMPFNRFTQKRLGKETKYDAIGNYLEYLDVILKEIYYGPAITHSRKFINYALARQPNAYKAIDRMLSDIKGKPSISDQNILGTLASSKPIQFIRSRVAANALVGNINFWATNLSNFSISYDELGNYMNVGMMRFLGDKKWRDFAFKNSVMLKGRSIDPDLDPTKYENIKKVVGAVTNLIEYNNVGSTFVGAYSKAIEQLKYDQNKAIKYADTIARRTQAGYKPYEMNAWMRSNSGKVLSQFQSWSFNMMNHIVYDLKLGNMPSDIVNFVKGNGEVKSTRWGALIRLVATSIAINMLYKAMGLREPYRVESYIPVLPGFNFRYYDISPVKIIEDIKTSLTSKNKDTRKKAAIRAATMLALPFGGAQAGRFLQGQVFPEKKGKKQSKRVGT